MFTISTSRAYSTDVPKYNIASKKKIEIESYKWRVNHGGGYRRRIIKGIGRGNK